MFNTFSRCRIKQACLSVYSHIAFKNSTGLAIYTYKLLSYPTSFAILSDKKIYSHRFTSLIRKLDTANHLLDCFGRALNLLC